MQTKTLLKRRARRAKAHQPGSTFMGDDGVKYRVAQDGSFRPAFDNAKNRKKRKEQRKARRRNR